MTSFKLVWEMCLMNLCFDFITCCHCVGRCITVSFWPCRTAEFGTKWRTVGAPHASEEALETMWGELAEGFLSG